MKIVNRIISTVRKPACKATLIAGIGLGSIGHGGYSLYTKRAEAVSEHALANLANTAEIGIPFGFLFTGLLNKIERRSARKAAKRRFSVKA